MWGTDLWFSQLCDSAQICDHKADAQIWDTAWLFAKSQFMCYTENEGGHWSMDIDHMKEFCYIFNWNNFLNVFVGIER